MNRFSRVFLPVMILALITACSPEPTLPTPTPQPPTVTPIPPPPVTPTLYTEPPPIPIDLSDVGVITPSVPVADLTLLAYTYQKPNGNRLAPGKGRMTSVLPLDIRLQGEPAWVLGVPVDGDGSIWTVVLTDGRIQAFLVLAGNVTPVIVLPATLPPGMPPLLLLDQGAPSLVTARAEDASPFTHPILIGGDRERLAYIATNGDLVIRQNGEEHRLEINALPDARIMQDNRERLLVYSGASDRYAHAVLGDRFEATQISLVETDPVRLAASISTGDQVAEGIAPIWTDLDDDGDWEIITTLSDDIDGARLVLFNEAGDRLAEGPPAGRGFRWLHQLAAVPLESGSSPVIVDILTPHIGGILELLRWEPGGGLNLLTSVSGYSTHALGSRNLDMALAGDLDGDGIPEILVPSQTRDVLNAFQFQNFSAFTAWSIGLGDRLSTNITGLPYPDGRLAVGLGLAGGILRLWLP